MITEAAINDLLKKLQDAPNERLVAYSEFYEDLFPGDEAEQNWKQLEAENGPALRAAVRMGLIVGKYSAWVPDFPNESMPDGADYIVSLSGLGTEKLLTINESMAQRALRQVRNNLPTIITSVFCVFIRRLASALVGSGR